jgi:hypothetical protein
MSSAATEGQVPDIYGQVHPVETPELIAQKQLEFETEIEKLAADTKHNLLQAQKQCPELLTHDFKLMFLRCEVFNADLAATRYAKYWDKRVEIFGTKKAFMPLTLSKALKDDIVALSTGYFSLTGSKDTSGRSIIFIDLSKQDKSKYPRESMCRAMWYIVHAALEDEMTQKRGVVIIGFPRNAKLSQIDRPLTKMNLESIKGCIPVRQSGIHICHPPTFFNLVLPILKFFMGERLRKRLQLHSGSAEKVLKQIAAFGLPKESMPTDLGGDIVVDHLGWLEHRRTSGLLGS